jgi:hypothetical protein
MKKGLLIVLSLVISFAFVTAVFAQPPATDKAASDKAVAMDKAAPEKKAKTHQFTGEVTAADMAAKTITLKSKKGEETFDVSGVKEADKIKTGEKVTVKYQEMDGKKMAKSVKMAKEKKATMKKEGKKEAAPAAEEKK